MSESMKQVLFVKEGRAMYGAELATYRLLTSLDRDVISPQLLVLEYSDQPSQFLAAVIDEDIPVEVAYSVGELGDKLKRLSQRCHAVVSIGYKSHILCWWYCRGLSIDRFAICHGWVATDAKLKLYNLVARRCLKTCKAVMTVSSTIMTGNNNSHVIYNGVDRRELERASQEPVSYLENLGPGTIVAYVGRLEKEKGVPELIQACAGLDQDIQLVLAGDGSLRPELETRAGTSDIPIQFLGYVENSAPLIKRADCLVLPSHTEALPLVVLEAMALGTVVLATPVGAVPDVIADEKNGFLLAGTSDQEIQSGIKRVLSFADVDSLVERARHDVDERFTQEAVAKRVQDVILGRD